MQFQFGLIVFAYSSKLNICLENIIFLHQHKYHLVWEDLENDLVNSILLITCRSYYFLFKQHQTKFKNKTLNITLLFRKIVNIVRYDSGIMFCWIKGGKNILKGHGCLTDQEALTSKKIFGKLTSQHKVSSCLFMARPCFGHL